MSIAEFWVKVYPLLLDRTVEKVERTLEDGSSIKAYWVADILRVDIKPPKKH